VRLAIPVFGALLITQLGLAFLSRAAPAMQIFSVGFAVSLVTGGTVLVLALPELAREISYELAQISPRIELVLRAVAEGSRE
jgi:flagellar biosynthetic protein FliR